MSPVLQSQPSGTGSSSKGVIKFRTEPVEAKTSKRHDESYGGTGSYNQEVSTTQGIKHRAFFLYEGPATFESLDWISRASRYISLTMRMLMKAKEVDHETEMQVWKFYQGAWHEQMSKCATRLADLIAIALILMIRLQYRVSRILTKRRTRNQSIPVLQVLRSAGMIQS